MFDYIYDGSLIDTQFVETMKRRYVSVLERRMPWSLFPVPEQLSFEQRVRILATYRQIQNICKYREAKSSLTFSEWSGVLTIPFSNTKISDYKNVRQSRSGRLLKNKPQYVDDGSDSDVSYCKKKNKKIRKSSTDGFSTQSTLDKNIENVSSVKFENTVADRTVSDDVKKSEIVYLKTNFDVKEIISKNLNQVSEISNDPTISNLSDFENESSKSSKVYIYYIEDFIILLHSL